MGNDGLTKEVVRTVERDLPHPALLSKHCPELFGNDLFKGVHRDVYLNRFPYSCITLRFSIGRKIGSSTVTSIMTRVCSLFCQGSCARIEKDSLELVTEQAAIG